MSHHQDGSAGERSTALAAHLRTWFASHGRDLPWRATRDPYRILVSEVMLQQTQVTRVIPAYHAFLDRFPTIGDLAVAPTAGVVEQWRGLGYNRRAVNLQRAARAVVERHGGQMPTTLAELTALSGIGAYTARAVLVFAHEQPVAAVDVNVGRVIQRAVTGRATPPAERQRIADDLVADAPWTTVQALMELGARHCTARTPRCDTCPILTVCAWRQEPADAPDPAPRNARAAVPFTATDRYHRVRLLDALRAGPLDGPAIPMAARTDDAQRARRIAESLVSDGLATWSMGTLALPES